MLLTPPVQGGARRRRGSSSLAKRIDADFFNFVGFLEFSVLALKVFDTLLFRSSSIAARLESIWGCLAEVPQRFGTHSEFRACRLADGVDGPVFVEVVEDQPDGSLMLLGMICIVHRNRMRHQPGTVRLGCRRTLGYVISLKSSGQLVPDPPWCIDRADCEPGCERVARSRYRFG